MMMGISFTALMEHTRFPQHKEPPEVRSVFVCLCLRQVCVCAGCANDSGTQLQRQQLQQQQQVLVSSATRQLTTGSRRDCHHYLNETGYLAFSLSLSLTLPLSAYRSCHSEGRRASAAAAVAAVQCTELYRTVLYSVLFHAHLSFSLTPGYPELWKTHSVELCLNANTHYTITREV